MQIEQICRNIISQEMNKETLLEIYNGNLAEKIQDRVRWMISGIESAEVNDGLIIKGCPPMSGQEDSYNQYKI